MHGQPLALIADRDGPIEMFPDHDVGLGVAAPMRAGEDLEQVLPEPHGVVVGHGALVREAADVLEVLIGGQWPVGAVRIGGCVSEARIIAGEEAREDRIRFLQGACASPAEFADQAILKGPPEPFDATLGLRRGGGDPTDAEVLQGAAKLRGRPPEAAQLLGECRRLRGIAVEDPVTVAVDRDRAAVCADHVPENPEVPEGLFLLAEEGSGDFARGIIDGAVEGKPGSPPFQPIMLARIELGKQAFLRHALTPTMIPAGPPGPRAGETSGDQPTMDRPVGECQSPLLDEGFGEMLVIEAGIGRLGPTEDPLPESSGQAVMRWAAAVAMRQGGGPAAAEGG